jgi:hypothetical protein
MAKEIFPMGRISGKGSFLQETPKDSIIITAITVEKRYFRMEIKGCLRMAHLF